MKLIDGIMIHLLYRREGKQLTQNISFDASLPSMICFITPAAIKWLQTSDINCSIVFKSISLNSNVFANEELTHFTNTCPIFVFIVVQKKEKKVKKTKSVLIEPTNEARSAF